jgi:hypothetical protein
MKIDKMYRMNFGCIERALLGLENTIRPTLKGVLMV